MGLRIESVWCTDGDERERDYCNCRQSPGGGLGGCAVADAFAFIYLFFDQLALYIIMSNYGCSYVFF